MCNEYVVYEIDREAFVPKETLVGYFRFTLDGLEAAKRYADQCHMRVSFLGLSFQVRKCGEPTILHVGGDKWTDASFGANSEQLESD